LNHYRNPLSSYPLNQTYPIMKKLVYLALAAGFLFSCTPKPVDTPVVVDNGPAMKARYTILNDCFSTGNSAAIDTLLAENAVDHSEDTTMHLPKGPAGLRKMIELFREGETDFKSEIKQMVAEGDVLMVYSTMSGTNSGPMMGMPATNKSWSADGVDVIKFGPDLKMVEHWGVFDQLKMMKDLGVIPSGPPPAKDKKAKK
jgi:predicted ester cyclase